MIKLKNKKLLRIGESYGIIVDYAYIKNGLINTTKRYNLELKEADSNESPDPH